MITPSLRRIWRPISYSWQARKKRTNLVELGSCHMVRLDGKLVARDHGGTDPRATVGRHGAPGEIAAVVDFLASDEASLITGAAVDANGCSTMNS
jgi:NAD(P)-dependent dehydrogenase (short-subunit alcohol dehydrogenase family)